MQDASQPLLTWPDTANAIDELLARATKYVDVFDADLRLQGWQSSARMRALHEAVVTRNVQVRIALLTGRHLHSEFPRLIALLKTYGHRVNILVSQASPKPDQFIAVADRQHCLFRPTLVRSNGFSHFENSSKSITYQTTFDVIWEQGGLRVFPEALGL